MTRGGGQKNLCEFGEENTHECGCRHLKVLIVCKGSRQQDAVGEQKEVASPPRANLLATLYLWPASVKPGRECTQNPQKNVGVARESIADLFSVPYDFCTTFECRIVTVCSSSETVFFSTASKYC